MAGLLLAGAMVVGVVSLLRPRAGFYVLLAIHLAVPSRLAQLAVVSFGVQWYWSDLLFVAIVLAYLVRFLAGGRFLVPSYSLRYLAPIAVFVAGSFLAGAYGAMLHGDGAAASDIRFIPFLLLVLPFLEAFSAERHLIRLIDRVILFCAIAFAANILASFMVSAVPIIRQVGFFQEVTPFGFPEIRLATYDAYLVGIPLSAMHALLGRGRARRRGVIILAIGLFSLLTYFSRAQLVLLSASAAIAYFTIRGQISPRVRQVLVGTAGITVLTATITGLLDSAIAYAQLFDAANSSNAYRAQEYQVASEIITDSSILIGAGFGLIYEFRVDGLHFAHQYLHNYYVFLVSKAGIILLAAFLWICGSYLLSGGAFKRVAAGWRMSAAYHGMRIALLSVLLSGMFTTNLFFGAHMVLPMLLGSILVCLRPSARGQSTAAPGAPPPASDRIDCTAARVRS